MLKIENVNVSDLKESVIACRNAFRTEVPEYSEEEFQKSLKTAIKLANTPNGSGEQTFLCGIRVSFDVTYPQYWTPEFQRYHFADIVTSSSKMHKLLKMDVNKSCNKYVSQSQIDTLQKDIDRWNRINNTEWIEGSKEVFVLRDGETILDYTKQDALYHAFMICISDCVMGLELFMRVTTNYQQLKTMYHQRKHHKLKEDWQDGFCRDFVNKLPYAKEFIIGERSDD